MSIITENFAVAAVARGKVLGLPEHPAVAIAHPIASCTRDEMRVQAERAVDAVAASLVRGQ